MTSANPASRRTSIGSWIRAIVTLIDGTRVELRLPAAIAGSVATYEPDPSEIPSLTVVKNGHRRRGRLGQFFGDAS